MKLEGWARVELGSCATFFKGSGLAKSDLTESGTESCIHYGELFTFYGPVIRQVESKCDQSVKAPRSQRGDVLMPGSDVTPRGLATASAVMVDGVVLGGDVIAIRPAAATLCGPFLAYIIRARKEQVLRLAKGSTVYHIHARDLSGLEIPLPPLAEQQAIAEALSDADALVESLDALIAKKRDMKQAAMQRFMAPGSTLPGATMVRLGDVVPVRKGELITESTAIPGDVPVIAGGKDAAYHCARWNRDGLTVTVSASGANAGYVKLRKGRLWASDCSTISESPEYDVRYVAAQLEVRQSKLYQSQFGGAQPHVRPNDIAAIEVCWVDVAQQKMIGEMIADMDAEIDAFVAQREKAELLKQGMMQGLLSGRVRLV